MSQRPMASQQSALWIQQLEAAAARGASGHSSNGCPDGRCVCHPQAKPSTRPSAFGLVLAVGDLLAAVFTRPRGGGQ